MKVHVDCMTSQKLVRLPGRCSPAGPASGCWEQLSGDPGWRGMAEGPLPALDGIEWVPRILVTRLLHSPVHSALDRVTSPPLAFILLPPSHFLDALRA